MATLLLAMFKFFFMNINLKKIIDSIEPINIREAIGIKEDNKNEQLKESHYLITVIDNFRQKANEIGYDFCTQNGFIYFFNGQYWQQTSDGEIRIMLNITANKMAVDKYKANHYLFIESLLKQFYASTAKLELNNNDQIKINLLNGTFEFGEACQLQEFKKDDFLTYQLPFNYNPKATAPSFEAYLNRVLPDVDCQNILAEFIGYVFTKGHKQQKCLLLCGGGSNGKSVFFEIVRALLSAENLATFSLRNLGEENCRAMISNKLLNYSSEMDANINKDTFKQLCCGEPLQARLKYKDSFMIENYAKLMFNCNELPKDVEYSNAYFRRFLIIPFTQTIPEAEQDKNLAAKIIANELSGIFNWVLEGLKRLMMQGNFTESELVNNTLKEFKQDADSVYQFIIESNYAKTDVGRVSISGLYKEYEQFCRDNGYRALNNKNFRHRLELQNIEIKRAANGYMVNVEKEYVARRQYKEEEFEDDNYLPFGKE